MNEICWLEEAEHGEPELKKLVARILSLRHCRSCGCIDALPCDEGCWWVEKDLCSACVS